MAEFYEGTLDTLMERLCSSIYSFNQEWIKCCVPAAEGQIRQLQDILAEYHYTVPFAYLHFLRKMGQDNGGLLGDEDDCWESDIGTVLECLDDREDLEKGFFLFSYNSWVDTCFYMELSSADDNPIVKDMKKIYVAESFEKYLFQRAFYMYKRSFGHSAFKNISVCHEKKEEENCGICPFCRNTLEERMDFIIRMTDTYGLKKAWFSDWTHFFCYDSNYAFEIEVADGYAVKFSCDDDKLWEQVRYSLSSFSEFFLYLSKFGDCGDRDDG